MRAESFPMAPMSLDRLFGLMELTAPYQASLDDVKWTEGPIPGRPVLTFAPKYFISLRGVRQQAAVDVAKFVDATDEAGFANTQNRTGNVAAPEGSLGPSALAAGDIDGDGTDD